MGTRDVSPQFAKQRVQGNNLRLCPQVLDDSRETMTASASTTPHRHFSQSKWRIDIAQPPPYTAPLPFVASPAPLLLAGTPGADAEEFVLERVSAGDDEEAAGAIRAVAGVDADPCASASGGGGAIPRSFWPMLGRSRAIVVQYYRCMSASVMM